MFFERWWHIARLRLRSLFMRDRVEDELNEELEDHLARRTQQFLAQGMRPDEARRAAIRAFGGVDQRREECRDSRGLRWLDDLRADVRCGVRSFARTPAFTFVAVLSPALGVGANAAVFALFDAVLLKPLAVERPDERRVVSLVVSRDGRDQKSTTTVPYLWLSPFRERAGVFSDVLAFAPLPEAEVRLGARQLSSPGGAVSCRATTLRCSVSRPTTVASLTKHVMETWGSCSVRCECARRPGVGVDSEPWSAPANRGGRLQSRSTGHIPYDSRVLRSIPERLA